MASKSLCTIYISWLQLYMYAWLQLDTCAHVDLHETQINAI